MIKVRKGFSHYYVRLLRGGGGNHSIVVIDSLKEEEKPEFQFHFLYSVWIAYGHLHCQAEEEAAEEESAMAGSSLETCHACGTGED